MTEAAGHAPFTCRVCAAQGDCAIFPLQEMMYGSREAFDYMQCGACGCLQIRTIPADLARHYPADYYSQQPRTEPPAPAGLKGFIMRWYCRGAAVRPDAPLGRALRALLPVPGDFAEYGHYLLAARLRGANERILDVGCGASPYLLAALRRCGFMAVEGIDPFVAADTRYEGVPVTRRTLDQVDGDYGLVMFHHSLEHVPDPLATLTQAARLLRPGATCLVRVPVMGTYFWRRFGQHWVELDAPRHLHLFTQASMDVLARRAGFHVRATVFDSEAWELTASMRYQQGIALRAPAGAAAPFSADELQACARQASELNTMNDAGRACFYLERC
ncbi:MAG: class I SAM-dependent methyltransferase [Pseudomonadota bacterium]